MDKTLAKQQRYLQAAAEIMLQCEELGTITATPGKVDRRYLTPEHKRCNALVESWMKIAGLQTYQDQAGNICGRLASPDPQAPTLLIGSHLDTVPDAGKYDGILGVLLPIAGLRILREQREQLPFHVDIVGFADEEGSRFGTTLLGSRAVAGTWKQEWFALKDADGISLSTAMKNFGCDPEAIASCSRAQDDLLGYFEVHIEQGPVLEAEDLPLGVVTSIAGARRFIIEITGHAGHAGTVPMALRQDALVAAARAVLMIEQAALRGGIVATVGQIRCAPGAPNVIPGSCQFSLDIRSGIDATRDEVLKGIQDEVNAMVRDRGLQIAWKETHNASAVGCAEWLQNLLEEVIAELQPRSISLLSGAGHDAMSFHGVCDVGMLFVRCAGGISHHPDESITQDDAAVALQAFCRSLLLLREKHGAGEIA